MKRVLTFPLILLALLLTLGIAQGLEIHFIDVGQGDSVLIRSASGQQLLYDGGDIGTEALDYLRRLGIENLNLVIASHNHADHIGGLPPVIRHYQPQFVMENGVPTTTRIYEDMLLAIEETGSNLLEPTERRISLGDVILYALPPPGIEGWGQNNSIGVLLEYGDFRFGLTGDAEAELFNWWHENVPRLMQPVQVYKSAHHGSEHGDTPLSVDRFQPEVVVIGVGEGNRYGHPHEGALRLYAIVDAEVYRTDLHGTIIVYANQDGPYSIETEREATSESNLQPAPAEPPQRAPGPATSASPPANCIDLNSASLEDLQRIQPIGLERAASIVQLRPFRTVQDLRRVDGIGPGRLRDIQAQGLVCVQ